MSNYDDPWTGFTIFVAAMSLLVIVSMNNCNHHEMQDRIAALETQAAAK